MRVLILHCFLLASLMQGPSPAQTAVNLSAPRLAVSPFVYPADPNYGVFVADRLGAQLMLRSYSQALARRRFVLVEPDTLPAHLPRLIASVATHVPEESLETLRRGSNADYLLTGVVDASGIRAVHARLVDLETGKLIWSGEI
ncbi:uncharacterized protein METZ01_LOCUS363426, partial [marine metagenome]